jgi:hypothetical protein
MEGQTPQGGNMADEAAAFEAQAAALRDRFGADFAHPLNGNEFGELSDRAKLAATPNAEAGDNLPAVVAARDAELTDLVAQATDNPSHTHDVIDLAKRADGQWYRVDWLPAPHQARDDFGPTEGLDPEPSRAEPAPRTQDTVDLIRSAGGTVGPEAGPFWESQARQSAGRPDAEAGS